MMSEMCLENYHWQKYLVKIIWLKKHFYWKKMLMPMCDINLIPTVDGNLMLTVDITKLSFFDHRLMVT